MILTMLLVNLLIWVVIVGGSLTVIWLIFIRILLPQVIRVIRREWTRPQP